MAPLDAKSLFVALVAAEVRFIVIGGFAVSAHGYLRGTKDLDIVPDPDPENLQRLAGALSQLDAKIMGMEEFSKEEVVQPDVAGLAMGGNFVLTTDYGRLDILQLVSPDFEYHVLVALLDELPRAWALAPACSPTPSSRRGIPRAHRPPLRPSAAPSGRPPPCRAMS